MYRSRETIDITINVYVKKRKNTVPLNLESKLDVDVFSRKICRKSFDICTSIEKNEDVVYVTSVEQRSER